MNKYEKIIGLKTIWTTILRKWHIFFIVFIPIASISFMVTHLMLKKTYISTVIVSRVKGTINSSQYSVIQSYVLDTSSEKGKEGAIYITVNNLKEEEFKHKNGSEITADEIKSGISFATLASNSTTVSFSFQSTDNSITQKVLDELTTASVANLKATAGGEFSEMQIMGSASAATKNSKENTYFLIALAVGAVIGFGIPFADEIVSDEVYDKYDIESLGCSAFEVKAKPKKKEA